MSESTNTSNGGETSQDTSASPKAPSAASLTAKYGHLFASDSAASGTGEGSDESVDGTPESAESASPEGEAAPAVDKRVPYEIFKKSREALRNERESRVRMEAENQLLRQQFEELRNIVQGGMSQGDNTTDTELDSDTFVDPELEALKQQLQALTAAEQARSVQAEASRMEAEWNTAVAKYPQIANAGQLVMSILRSDSSISVAQAAEMVAGYIPAPVTAPVTRPQVKTPAVTPTPTMIRPLPASGGVTTPARSVPTSYKEVNQRVAERLRAFAAQR